jgi:AhpC/TSA family
VECQKSIVAVTSRHRVVTGYDAPSSARSGRRRCRRGLVVRLLGAASQRRAGPALLPVGGGQPDRDPGATPLMAQHRSHTPRTRARRRKPRRMRWGLLAVAAAALVVAAMLLVTSRDTTRQATQQAAKPAPAFTLASTDGRGVSLADYAGRNVLLYFSEDVGCDGCWYQMADLEQHQSDLDKLGLTVLPVVVNDPAATRAEMRRFNLRTPFPHRSRRDGRAPTARSVTAPPCTPTCRPHLHPRQSQRPDHLAGRVSLHVRPHRRAAHQPPRRPPGPRRHHHRPGMNRPGPNGPTLPVQKSLPGRGIGHTPCGS